MSLNNTPSAERIHIGIFGRRNAGKSSLINALTGQNLAIVSDVKGTTTDPVLKAMELLPLGPVVMIDTPGLDDKGELGSLRIKKAYQILNKTDIAVLVLDGSFGMTAQDEAIFARIQAKKIPYVIVLNKADLVFNTPPNHHISDVTTTNATATNETTAHTLSHIDGIDPDHVVWVSTTNNIHIHELKEMIASLAPAETTVHPIVGDLIQPSDFVILVIPIDKAAPKGRLILPQQQTIRDILDHGANAIVVQENELIHTLNTLVEKPSLVITDSQVFAKVSADTPKDIPLTSFSILFARYKGNLETVVKGARALDTLEENDTILISEGCTHHRQCEDIGTVKLPRLVQNYTKKHINFEFTSGTDFPLNVDKYKLIIHCGGCMLNEREMKYRLKCAEDAHVPITNYGTAIAYIQGILERSIAIFAS